MPRTPHGAASDAAESKTGPAVVPASPARPGPVPPSPAPPVPANSPEARTSPTPPQRAAIASAPPLRRLKQRRDFLRIAAKGGKAAREGLVLQGAPTPAGEAGALRVGFTASRKVGNAVARNRAKRRLRAVADLVLRGEGQAGHDYVLIGRKATLERDFAALCGDCRSALRRLRPDGTPAPRRRQGKGQGGRRGGSPTREVSDSGTDSRTGGRGDGKA